MPVIQEKSCFECGASIKGRMDKKFCSDQCRSMYNNRLNSDETNYVRNVNNTLRKNRRILMALNPEGTNRVSHQRLRSAGFDFAHFTSVYTNRDGVQYFYCYEHGYRSLENDHYLLVIKKGFSSRSGLPAEARGVEEKKITR